MKLGVIDEGRQVLRGGVGGDRKGGVGPGGEERARWAVSSGAEQGGRAAGASL